MVSVEDRFGVNLRRLRERARLTQADIARLLEERHGIKLHPSAIAKIENRDVENPRAIRLEEAVAISSILGLTVTQLISNRSELEELALALEEIPKMYVQLEVGLMHVETKMRKLKESAAELDLAERDSPEDSEAKRLLKRINEAIEHIRVYEDRKGEWGPLHARYEGDMRDELARQAFVERQNLGIAEE